jgi:predicted TIM-barrel fold metal-dependent hydrolase
MKTITLEEHFVTAEFLKATEAYGSDSAAGMAGIREKLLDVGAGRIAAMDEGGVSVQVLSLAAIGAEHLKPAEQTAVMRSVHDEAAAAVKAHPERFRAFATPGLKEPKSAVKELDRCVTELGFVGMLVNGMTEIDGQPRFLDAPEFFHLLETAESLGVPVYVIRLPHTLRRRRRRVCGSRITRGCRGMLGICCRSPGGAGMRSSGYICCGWLRVVCWSGCRSCR